MFPTELSLEKVEGTRVTGIDTHRRVGETGHDLRTGPLTSRTLVTDGNRT